LEAKKINQLIEDLTQRNHSTEMWTIPTLLPN